MISKYSKRLIVLLLLGTVEMTISLIQLSYSFEPFKSQAWLIPACSVLFWVKIALFDYLMQFYATMEWCRYCFYYNCAQ